MEKREKKKKRVIFISWKDIKNPQAGGAEIVQHELAKRLVKSGHEVISLTPGFDTSTENDQIDGVQIIRVGKSVLSFVKLAKYYKDKLHKENDILIDVFNCFGSFGFLFNEKSFLLIHHVQGKIWLHERKFPFIFPVNLVGWLAEKIQLFLIARLYKGKMITVSNSTKSELTEYGFKKDKIQIITEGVDILRADKLYKKSDDIFNVLFIGRLVSMKKPLDSVKAFEIFNKKFPKSKMYIAGDGNQKGKIQSYLEKRNLTAHINYLGRISNDEKLEVMRKSHVLLVSSVKEGWGLVVTEANSQGTPAIAYNTSGLRDSVIDGKTGLICKKNTPKDMALQIEKVYNNRELLHKLSISAYEFSADYSYDKSFEDFQRIIGI